MIVGDAVVGGGAVGVGAGVGRLVGVGVGRGKICAPLVVASVSASARNTTT
jgi:hypothetical protein